MQPRENKLLPGGAKFIPVGKQRRCSQWQWRRWRRRSKVLTAHWSPVSCLFSSSASLLCKGMFLQSLPAWIKEGSRGAVRPLPWSERWFGGDNYRPWSLPGDAGGKEPVCQCRQRKRHRFDPWVRKMPWRRAWQPTPVILPGKSHGQRSLAGYSPEGHRVRHDWSDLAGMHRLYWWGVICTHFRASLT